jgi:hypothetical protein
MKLTYVIFTGNSERMPFQVMTNQTAVVAQKRMCLCTSSSGSPVRSDSGRKMHKDDYLAECNTM